MTPAERRAREVLGRIVPELARLPGVTRIRLYGSLAYRRFHERSDIDIAVENALAPDRWHEELLRRMTLEIPGVRPAVIGEETRSSLGELRTFRHFFRHNYASFLRPDAIARVGEAYRIGLPTFREAIRRFLAAVGAMIEGASGA